MTATISFIRSAPACKWRFGVRRSAFDRQRQTPNAKRSLRFGVRLHLGPVQAVGEQLLQVLGDGPRVAAAEAEAVARDGRHVRVDVLELPRRWGLADLAQRRPRLGQ